MADKYDAAIRYARELGATHGRNAASWVEIDESNAATILAGITDGDPEVMDTLPSPDLSGQWADSLTGPELVHDAFEGSGAEDDPSVTNWFRVPTAHVDWFDDVCSAYEDAFSEHAQYAVEDRCRYHLTPQA